MNTKFALVLFIGLIVPILSEEPSAIAQSFTPTESIDGDILALALAPDGGAYFGGNFNKVSGDSKVRFLAKMNDDGSLESSFKPDLDGSVVDLLVQENGLIIAAGNFETAAGTRHLARFHPDGSPDTEFNAIIGEGSNGFVTGIDLLPDGKIIVAGSFTTWAGISLNQNRNLIMLDSNGTLRGAFANGIFSTTLSDVAVLPDDKILVCHLSSISGTVKVTRFKNDFTQDSGFNFGSGRRRVDRLNLTKDGQYLFAGINTLLAQADGSAEIISEESSYDLLEQRNGKIVVAGESLTRFLAPGTLDPDFSEVSFNEEGEAHRLALRPDGRIWIAGSFSIYNDTNASGLVLINGDVIPLGIVKQAESKVLDPGETVRFEISAVGTSTLFYQWQKDGIAVNDSARITGATSRTLEITNLGNNDSGSYTCLVTNEAGEELSEAVELIVRGIPYFVVLQGGGQFPAGNEIRLMGEVIALGTVNYQWRKNGEVIVGANSNVLTIPQVRDADSGSYTLEATNELGRTVSEATEVMVKFNPAAIAADFRQPLLNGAVTAIEPLSDGAVLIGGLFGSANDGLIASGRHLAVVEKDGSIRNLPELGANGAVTAINRDAKGNFLIAGEFTSVNGIFRSRVARLLPDLTVDPTFDPGTGPNFGLFNAREAPDGTIHIAGKHTAWNGDPLLNYHTRLNPDGTVVLLYLSPASNWINDAIPLPDGKVLLGGRSFNPDDDTTTNTDNYLYRLNEDGDFDASFEGDVDFQSPTKLLIDRTGRIYANSPIGNTLNRFLSDGSRDLTFRNDRPDQRVTSMFLDAENRILIGGRFEMFDGENRVRFLRINADDSLDEEFVSGTGPDNQVDAIAESDDGSIWIGGSFKNYNGVPATNLVRLIGGQSPSNDFLLNEFLVAANVPGNMRGPNDDPDHDGLPNVIEFIYGSDPLTAQSLLAKSSLSFANGSEISGANLDPAKQYHVLELEIPTNTQNYTLIVEGSSHLSNFSETSLILFGESIGDESITHKRYYFFPDRGVAPQFFWRLKVVN